MIIVYGFFETLYLTQGIYQLLIRLMEVEFRETMKKDLNQYYRTLAAFCGCQIPEPIPINKEGELQMQPFYMFLNSELNEQLVYAILHGINVVNDCSRCAVDAFEDITAVRGMHNFKIQDDGNAILTLDHYMIYKARRGQELRNSVDEEQLQ